MPLDRTGPVDQFSQLRTQNLAGLHPNIFNNLPLGRRRGGAEAPPFRGTG